MKERVFSGIQPTGEMHIGNYFGAVVNYVRLQEQHDCIYSIVDYHAITVEHDPKFLPAKVLSMAADLLACGIDPKRAILFVQSHVPEHTELAWIFNCLTSFGDLGRMTQFKDKSEQQEFVSAGLFDYPVLQAADILLYRASKVPVGEDQLQHLELARRIARRFNGRFGEFFPEVEPILSEAPRLMSPADPGQKMSKSLGDKHYIGVMEPEASIREKIKTAVTDVGPRGEQMSPGVANLFLILKLSADSKLYAELEQAYQAGTLRYVRLKEAVAESLLGMLRPLQARRRELEKDLGSVRLVLEDGASRAREIAQQNMKEIRRLMGVGPESLKA
ncbi:MAG: tryptophan--tRNA ligase [Candidatus Acetothermia bacterium]|nr:tryptophan--tRNA ligase [Candidatus Acetothermia bacterium]MDH7505936.1 tryptophan--tRNA ligase [Candidatus Acetothermia bacterium]